MSDVKKVLVDVDETVWGKVRARALEEGVAVSVVVGRALRGEMAWRDETGSAVRVTGDPPLAAERREGATALVRPTKDQLQALVERVAPGTTLDVTASADPMRGKATVETRPVSSREAERARRAAQDRLRTSPEDESQAHDDEKAGF